jgi:molybdenum cofactor biosynthesis protein B
MPPHRIDETVPFVPVRIAVMAASDTRDASDDVSGGTLAQRIKGAGHGLAKRTSPRNAAKT